MKRLTFFLATTFATILAIGQVTDITETNCDSQTASVYDQLNDGKSLLVIASGYDCSICINEAPGAGNWADQHIDEVVVWGAMHFRFNPMGSPSCNALDNWVTDHGWENIFTFNDVNNETPRYWANGGYPSYRVIDPLNKEVVYSGFSLSAAQAKALEKSEVTTAIAEWKAPTGAFNFTLQGESVKISGANQSGTFFLYDSLGKIILQKSTSENNTIDLSSIPSGQMYFGVLKSENNIISKRIILD